MNDPFSIAFYKVLIDAEYARFEAEMQKYQEQVRRFSQNFSTLEIHTGTPPVFDPPNIPKPQEPEIIMPKLDLSCQENKDCDCCNKKPEMEPSDSAKEWEEFLARSKDTTKPAPSPLEDQIGGNHYLNMKIQPIEALKSWLTPEEFRGWIKGSALYYIARERLKGGDQDLDKAAHILELFKSLR